MPDKFLFRPVLLACLIVSIGQLSVGLLFPSLPWIAQEFQLPAEQVQLLISIYLLGFGPSQLLYGPLSDSLGRKPILLIGLLLAVLGLTVSVVGAAQFEWLLAGRFIQGLGAGCCAVLARASIRDSYSAGHLTQALTWLAMVASICPIIAPVIGGFINHHFGWLAVFVVLLSYVALVWLIFVVIFKETLAKRKSIQSPKVMLKQYKQLAGSAYFVSFSAIGWLNYGLVVVAISLMPFVMQVEIGMSSDQYAMWSLLPTCGLLVGGMICNRFRPRIGTEKMLKFAPLIQVTAGMWLILCPLTPFAVMSGQFLMIVANGVAFPCAQSQLLLPYKDNAGAVAALSGACQMVFASLLSMGLMSLGIANAWHLGVLLLVAAALSYTLISLGFRSHSEHRNRVQNVVGGVHEN
ncbi:multidrug effflux MFS transporter [Thaumasiovibrio subtropicus]|uniref:multidrug effflux MFS transporter n=1 Tax=Thaumasiovibrio subtropicus TaxID=1891207 RepID=UPI000B35AF4C|nr:multidrug effflux MFS transporter [Thaumasiovibrio subtropicus]